MPDNTQKSMIDQVLPWSAAASSVSNPLFAHLTNVKNRKFSREMYKTQRKDALADWQMQNEYNSPRAQMQRYQEAGLNPHLIYGQSNEGATVRSSSVPAGSANAPQVDSSGLMAGYDMRYRSAQTDMVARQMELVKEEIGLKKVQQYATLTSAGLSQANTERVLFELGLAKELRSTTIAGKEAEVVKIQTEVDKMLAEKNVLLARNEREAAMNAKSLEEITERIISIRAGVSLTGAQIDKIRQEIILLKKDERIKELDAQLADKGVRPGDPLIFRYLGGIVEGIYRKLFGGKEEGNNPDRFPGETLEEYRRRKAIGKHE